MKHLKKLLSWMCAVVLIGGLTLCTSCTSNKDNAPSVEASQFIPKAPDYNDATMWVTADGDTDGTGADIFYVVSTWEEDWTQRTMVNGQWSTAICHYADVWNQEHRDRMRTLEIDKVAAYIARQPFLRPVLPSHDH
jgi:hypothetical protein